MGCSNYLNATLMREIRQEAPLGDFVKAASLQEKVEIARRVTSKVVFQSHSIRE
jgi:hypothetical protein